MKLSILALTCEEFGSCYSMLTIRKSWTDRKSMTFLDTSWFAQQIATLKPKETSKSRVIAEISLPRTEVDGIIN